MSDPVEIPPPNVLDKLERLLREKENNGLIRLLPKAGTTPALVTEAGTARTQILKSFDEATGFVEIQSVGTGANPAKFVRLTRKGIKALFLGREAKHLKRLLAEAAPWHQGDCQEIALSVFAQEQRKLGKEQEEIERKEHAIYAAVGELVRAISGQLEREKATSDERRRVLAELEAISKPAAKAAPAGEEIPPPKALKVPTTEAEFDFQLAVATELVFAWNDAANEEAAFQLERVLDNSPGIERIGEPEQQVEFNGSFHETTAPLKTGDPAIVTRSGWRLLNTRGTTLLARAKVNKP